jgi:chromosome segregation ATPase
VSDNSNCNCEHALALTEDLADAHGRIEYYKLKLGQAFDALLEATADAVAWREQLATTRARLAEAEELIKSLSDEVDDCNRSTSVLDVYMSTLVSRARAFLSASPEVK